MRRNRPRNNRRREFPDIISSLAGNALRLVQRELQLLRLDVQRSLSQFCRGIVLGACAIVFVVTMLVFAGMALNEWLTVLLGSPILSAASIAGGMALIALVLVLLSRRAFSIALQPGRTWQSLAAIAELFSSRGPDER